MSGDYSFGIGLDQGTIDQIDAYAPNCIHFTVPDFVALDGIRYCQRNNIAYIGTWHSNYVDYLKYYFIEWVLGPGFHRYLKGFFEQIPTVYVPTTYVRSTAIKLMLSLLLITLTQTHVHQSTHASTHPGEHAID